MTPVRGLLPEEIGGMWTTIQPLINKGLQYSDGTLTAEQIGVELMRGSKQAVFCPNPVCILITQLLNYPDGTRTCDVFLTAGTFPNDWQTILSGVEGWAKERGCKAIEMRSPRKGWTRRLPDWRPVTVIYRKELRA